MQHSADTLTELNSVFGSLRAEYLHEEMFGLFTRPSYWPALITDRPCLLTGGRGTGKTTVLRSLSYEGQWNLGDHDLASWKFVGLYWRIDTSVVSTFVGEQLDDAVWAKVFGHYVNLMLVQLVVEFLDWKPEPQRRLPELSKNLLTKVCKSLHLPNAGTVVQLLDFLETALIEFESVINNIDGHGLPRLSMLGRPISILLAGLQADPILSKQTVFFLFDRSPIVGP